MAAIPGAGVGFPFLGEMSAHCGETAMGCEEPGAQVTLVFGVSVGLARGLGPCSLSEEADLGTGEQQRRSKDEGHVVQRKKEAGFLQVLSVEERLIEKGSSNWEEMSEKCKWEEFEDGGEHS